MIRILKVKIDIVSETHHYPTFWQSNLFENVPKWVPNYGGVGRNMLIFGYQIQTTRPI